MVGDGWLGQQKRRKDGKGKIFERNGFWKKMVRPPSPYLRLEREERRHGGRRSGHLHIYQCSLGAEKIARTIFWATWGPCEAHANSGALPPPRSLLRAVSPFLPPSTLSLCHVIDSSPVSVIVPCRGALSTAVRLVARDASNRQSCRKAAEVAAAPVWSSRFASLECDREHSSYRRS